MTDFDVILEKITNLGHIQAEYQAKTDTKLDSIGAALQSIALQQKDIDHVQKDVEELWRKHDEAFGQNGTIATVREFQQSCPRDHFKSKFRDVWATITFIFLCMSGLAGWIVVIMKGM